jgi:DNA-binding NarL/FixJ family response regulator
LIGLYRKQDVRMRRCRERLDRLSTREGEILRHLMAGRSVCEIAAQRFVSEATVRTQVKAILFKLELKSQLAAVAAARDGGWDPEALPIAV